MPPVWVWVVRAWLEIPRVIGVQEKTDSGWIVMSAFSHLLWTCGAQNFAPSLRSLLFEAIFAMQSTENRR